MCVFEPVSYVIKYITTFKIISPRGVLASQNTDSCRDIVGTYLHFVLDGDNYIRQSDACGLIIRYKIQCCAATIIEISITLVSLR